MSVRHRDWLVLDQFCRRSWLADTMAAFRLSLADTAHPCAKRCAACLMMQLHLSW
jgi:hypothetical protein